MDFEAMQVAAELREEKKKTPKENVFLYRHATIPLG
jgi:hypothetical protein